MIYHASISVIIMDGTFSHLHILSALSKELKRFPSLQVAIAGAAGEALEKFGKKSKKTIARLVEMESSYLTVELLLHTNWEKRRIKLREFTYEANCRQCLWNGWSSSWYREYYFKINPCYG